jgi:DNA polymerase-3 subunit epsilon
MRLRRKLTLAVLGLFLPPTTVAGIVLLLLYRRGVLEDPSALFTAVIVGLVTMMAYLALVARGLGASLVRTIEEMRRGAELMATVNADRRLEIQTGDELEALAAEINRLADRLRVAREGLDEHAHGATRALRAEGARLSAVLDALVDGVIVAGADGRITLANPVARRLLNGGEALLGRMLVDFLDQEGLTLRLADLGSAAGSAHRFRLETAAGVPLHCVLTRVLEPEGGPLFVLVLRDAVDKRLTPEEGSILEQRSPGPDRLPGMGLRSGPGGPAPGPIRSELYDFSLLDEIERHVGPADRDHRLDELGFVVFDTETTGLRPDAGDRVISLAGVRVAGTRVKRRETFDALVHPGRPVPPDSTRFHGITDRDVAGAPPLDVVLPAFLAFVGHAVLVGHEASFDMRFLAPEARRLCLPSLTSRPILDTRLLSRSLHGPAEDHSLEAIALQLGVPVVGRHSALGDALTTAEIFVRLLVLLDKRGVRTLGEALDAVRRARTPII